MAANPVIEEIKRQGRGKKRSQILAALETGRIETNFTEIPGGDADSQNWRQEREQGYGAQWAKTGGPLNTRASVARFYAEAAKLDHGQPSYELAADVQRPAAQYRGRYKDAHSEAMRLIAGTASSGVPASSSRVPARASAGAPARTTSTQVFDQAGYDKAVRRQKVAQLLQHSGRGKSILFRSGLLSTMAPDQAAFTSTQTTTTPAGRGADTIDAATTPSSGALSAAIHAARSQLGVRETPGVNNRGPEVDKLEKGFGMVAQPWCGIYLGTVLRKAGVHVDSRVASVSEIETMARNHDGAFSGGWHSAAHARQGDALITRKGEHVAFVESVDPDGTIHTIGGNQGAGDVSRRTYKPGEVYGAARPRYRRR